MRIFKQFSKDNFIYIIMLILSGVVFLTLFLLNYFLNVPLYVLAQEPTTVGNLPIYAGFLSQVGIFFWAGAIAINFMAYYIVRKSIHTQLKYFFLYVILLTVILCLDDIFLLHEIILGLKLGVPEILTFGVYGLAILFLLFYFYKLILLTNYLLLGLALMFFGGSMVVDLFDLFGSYSLLFEDGAKFLGIVSWFAYFFSTCFYAVEINYKL